MLAARVVLADLLAQPGCYCTHLVLDVGESDLTPRSLPCLMTTTLLLSQTDGSSEAYTGALKAPELRSFLDSHAPDEPLPPPQGAGKAGSGLHDPLGQLAQVEVASLGAGNLTEINAHDDMWLIGFYATAGVCVCVDTLVAAGGQHMQAAGT